MANDLKDFYNKFGQSKKIPFNNILDSAKLQPIFEKYLPKNSRDRIFNPIATICAFVSQVMNPDSSCNQTVADFVAYNSAKGNPVNSSSTSSYCDARKRLPEILPHALASQVGHDLHNQADREWKWLGRNVKIVDGTTTSMTDTLANQKEYPQSKSQKEGIGFPTARIVAISSQSTGGFLDFAIGPNSGKKTGEHALLRELLDNFKSGDVCLGDKYYCSYFLIAELLKRGVDSAFPLHASRTFDPNSGLKISEGDHLTEWKKPNRPDWMSKEEYSKVNESITVRETNVGKNTVIVSTFLNSKKVTKEDIKELYNSRWNIETDLFSLKEVFNMGVLRCNSPEMIRKEISIHLLAYNLVRTVMAQAAKLNNKKPRAISFMGAKQNIIAFNIHFQYAKPKNIYKLQRIMLDAIAHGTVGNRPGRHEPREVKRRNKTFPYMTIPRSIQKKTKLA